MSGKPHQYDLYDGLPPHVDSDTSEEAAERIASETGRLQAMVLDEVRRSGGHGRTDDELEVALGLRHQTASARRRELVLKGLVEDSGRRRATRSGRKATVWVERRVP
jgi:hypothetical protein